MRNDSGRASVHIGIAVAACLAFTLACGLGGGDTESPPEAGQSATVLVADEPTESVELPVDETFTVGQTFWHSGFRVTIEDGRYYSEEEEFTSEVTYFVTLETQIENLGDSAATFIVAVALTWDGESAPMRFSSETAQVAAGLTSSATFTFEVDAQFNPNRAMLIVGTPDENRAMVPLGDGAGELVSLEPSIHPLTGTISLELIDLGFKSAELRADRQGSYSEIENGKRALTLNFDVTSRKSGSWTINTPNFTLTLPSGVPIGADGGYLPSFPGSELGTVTRDLFLVFLVDYPSTGSYTLRFLPGSWLIPDGGATEGTFEFTLE